jgi:hypothetical protein
MSVTLSQLESKGITLFSRWRTEAGNTTIIIDRVWTIDQNRMQAVAIKCLDLMVERAHEVAADDFVRWKESGRIIRIK